MKTIHKYSIPGPELSDVITFDMPTDAKVLSVGNQRECLCIWAEVETDTIDPKNKAKPMMSVRLFRVAGTGHPLEVGLPLGRFIGTVMFANGSLVFHIYEGET